ncbi:MAG: hypothetical protein IKX57_00565, partial [Oscillospiraceae bacterium]|nr:hypothetical protein [Oscillospiraceae bacterium]
MKLTERIGSGENVLWYGKKAWYVTAAEAMLNLFLPYLLIWPLLKGVFIVRPGLLARLERSIFIELMIELLPIWLMIYLVVVLCKVIGLRQTEYCVTDKGVYVVFGNAVPKKLVRKPFGALTDVKCKRGLLDKLLGTGVVSATSATMVGEPGSELSVRGVEMKSSYELAFRHITDYESVMQLISQKQQEADAQNNYIKESERMNSDFRQLFGSYGAARIRARFKPMQKTVFGQPVAGQPMFSDPERGFNAVRGVYV